MAWPDLMLRLESIAQNLPHGGDRRHVLFASASPLAIPRMGGAGAVSSLWAEVPFAPRGYWSDWLGDDGAGPDDSAAPKPVVAKTTRFVILAEIANFVPLRRHLGAPRADCLVLDVADRVGAMLADARMAVVGRNMVEVAFEGDARHELDAVLAGIAALFEQPVSLDGEPHRIDLLLGAAHAPVGVGDDVRLAEEAEEALRLARAEGRPVVRDIVADAPAFDRVTLVSDLSKAIERGELFLQYQPKLHLRQQKICSVEALVRWQHPKRGLILPGDFIETAEQAQLIGPISLWTLEQAIADQKLLAAQGHDVLVFVNISGQLLGDAPFVARACQLLSDAGCRIGIEITETSVIRDPKTAIKHLKLFADLGISIAIDDYGAGLSSLAYLKRLPARELKIDKMFVLQLTSSNRDPLIVRSTIDLAHALDMEVTAEGVETPAALALLSVMGCDMAQGFLISRPIALGALCSFLDEERHEAVAAASRSGALNRPASFWKSV